MLYSPQSNRQYMIISEDSPNTNMNRNPSYMKNEDKTNETFWIPARYSDLPFYEDMKLFAAAKGRQFKPHFIHEKLCFTILTSRQGQSSVVAHSKEVLAE